MKSGRVLWDELALKYQNGVNWTRRTRKNWDALKNDIDAERHLAITKKLAIQERDAVWWKDANLSYFQIFSKRPFPKAVEKSQRTLEEYKTIDLLDDFARGKGTFDENH